jgi:hypothetical protein
MTPGSLVTLRAAWSSPSHPGFTRRDFFAGAHTYSLKIVRILCVLLSALHHGWLVLLNIAAR